MNQQSCDNCKKKTFCDELKDKVFGDLVPAGKTFNQLFVELGKTCKSYEVKEDVSDT